MILRILRKLKTILKDFKIFCVGRIIRTFFCPRIPVNLDGKVLIHIGCGELNDPRYINIDTRTMRHIHFISSIEDVQKILPAGYADLIYACHALEHVSHNKLKKTIVDLYKCLKSGGILRISVPDFDVIVGIYKENQSVDSIIKPLMGGQDYKSNFHFSVFNKNYLTKLLLESGFEEVREWEPDNAPYHNFDDWSGRRIILFGKEWKISLNLEGVK